MNTAILILERMWKILRRSNQQLATQWGEMDKNCIISTYEWENFS